MIKETQEATEAKTFLWGRYASQTSVVLPFSESSDKGTHSSKPVEVLPCLLPPISQQVLYPFFSSQISQPSTGALPPDMTCPSDFMMHSCSPWRSFREVRWAGSSDICVSNPQMSLDVRKRDLVLGGPCPSPTYWVSSPTTWHHLFWVI